MNKLYEVLEICLQEIEQGADIDTVLFRYPDFADELRPILEASVNAKSMAASTPSAEVVRRNRAKVLQHAAQMRESKVRSSRRIWFASLRRVAVTLAVVTTLFVSGTGLVRAASTTVPGDNLYPVKRTWEDVLLLFTFNLQQREALEIEHENERLHELRELFAEGRDEDVDFAGQVTSQIGNAWVVSGVPVVVSSQTEIRDQGQGIVVGSSVRVEGHTQDNGAVLAEEIKLLPPDAKLPSLDDDHGKKESHEVEDRQDNSGKGSDDDGPKVEETEESDSDSGKDDSSSDDSNSGKDDSGSDDDESDNSGSGGGSDDGGNDSGSDDDDDSGGDNSGSGGGDDNDD